MTNQDSNTNLVLPDGLHLVEYNKELVLTFPLYDYMLYNILYACFGKKDEFLDVPHHFKTSIPQRLIKI